MDAASQCEMTQLPWNFTLSHKTQQSLMFSYWKSNKCTITSMTGSDSEKGNTVDVMSVCQSIDSWPEISCFHTTKLPVFAFFCVKGTDAAAWEEHVLFVSVSLSMRSQLIGNFTLSPVTQHKFSHLLFYVWNVSTQAAYFQLPAKAFFFFCPLVRCFLYEWYQHKLQISQLPVDQFFAGLCVKDTNTDHSFAVNPSQLSFFHHLAVWNVSTGTANFPAICQRWLFQCVCCFQCESYWPIGFHVKKQTKQNKQKTRSFIFHSVFISPAFFVMERSAWKGLATAR